MWQGVRQQVFGRRWRYWAALACLLLPGLCAPSAAASSVTYKGITVTPAVVPVDLQAGQVRAAFDIQVVNNTKDTQQLNISSLDFKSLNQSGGLAFITNKASQLGNQHGLASWLDLGNPTVELTPGQVKTLHFGVENRSDLAPGGHYAAVLFQATHANSGSGTNRVASNEVVSALVFVRKIEGARFGIAIADAAVPTNWLTMPNSVNVVLKNTGNTQEIPRGLITISGPFNSEVSRGIINPDSSLLLPDSSRLFAVDLRRTKHAWWPGLYRVHISYRHDGTTTVQEATTAFLYLNPWFLILCIGLVVATYYVIRKRRRFYRHLKRLHKH